jgi:23S rRNA pseudouridine1911/1915/1917 synthase
MDNITLPEDVNGRLDKVLSGLLDFSRAKIQKAILSGAILVNDVKEPTKYKVQPSDKITLDPVFFAERTDPIDPPPPLDIIYEDGDVFVINKPSKLLVHKTESSHEPTVADAAVLRDAAIADVGDHPDRPGIVHRLDKLASGVMIIARNQASFLHLKDQFKERKTEKHYSVLVHGKMSESHGTINLPITRGKSSGRMAAKPISQGGKEAITHYNVEVEYQQYSLLDVQIETGRTHQIRAHMFSQDHPVVGDMLYKQRGTKEKDIGGRFFLHAKSLRIELPSGEEKTFEAPLPDELTSVLEGLHS